MAGNKIVVGVKNNGKFLIIWIADGLQMIDYGLCYFVCVRNNGGR